MKTRTETEMYELLREYIERDDRIRLAIINGSRANPLIKKDMFQDYDISCFVTDVKPFLNEANVLPYFGDTIVVEQPNIGPWPPEDADGRYHNYNIQLIDGNRIDITFNQLDLLEDKMSDSLSMVFIDKDHLCDNLPDPSESSYYISKPTEQEYKGCCNAFFFALGSHIPKTIWRQQLPLLKFYTEGWLRVPLRLMLSWEIGRKTGFDKSLGACGKYMEMYMNEEDWEKYRSTHVDDNLINIWDSLFDLYDIFVKSAKYIAEEYGYVFPEDTAKKVLTFLKHVRTLPCDTDTIY